MEEETIFNKIVDILKRYVDMDEKYYTIVTLWIVGTYFHDNFRTFPYLFLNASKGSGKTRLLKLIAFLSDNGKVLGLPSEAFLFRMSRKMTFCLDEMENIERKESNSLRLLLNSSYKKGLFIPRMKKNKDGDMITEEFEAFAPICIANIWGLDDVLQDRCISITLEKSKNPSITRKIEAWEYDDDVKYIKNFITNELKQCSLCSVVMMNRYVEKIWNDLLDTTQTTQTTTTTTTQLNTQTTPSPIRVAFSNLDWKEKYEIEPTKELMIFIEGVYESNLSGRNLEIYFPLFAISSLFGDNIFKNTIKIASEETIKKDQEDIFENRDTTLIYSLLMMEGIETLEWISINTIKNNMKEIVGEEKEKKDGSIMKTVPKWLNSKWLGRALKRLNLNKNKRRTSHGIDVIIDMDKLRRYNKIYGLTNQTTF